MKEILPIDIKKIEIKILDYIDKICKENGITYFLAAGTLIGVVRHKGFIPWDDDIDIFMKREDYMKFVNCAMKDSQNYECLSLYTDENYYLPFLKVVDKNTVLIENGSKPLKNLGVWVDIFPLDFYNSKYNQIKRTKIFKNKFTVSVEDKFYKTRGFVRTFIKLIAHILYGKKDPRLFAQKIDKIAMENLNYEDKLFVGMSPFDDKDVFDSNWFSETIELEFEGKLYSAPKGFDKILTKRYGNYMQLPPIEQRIGHHNFKAYYKELDK